MQTPQRCSPISPHVRKSGFCNPRKFCLWNPESWALESGVQLKESGIQADWNPESKLYRQIIRNQEPISSSEQLPYQLHGVFTDQLFYFRHILGDFFPRKQKLHHVYEYIIPRKYKISKRKTKRYQKGKNIIFRSVGFADWFMEIKRYSNFAPKPF